MARVDAHAQVTNSEAWIRARYRAESILPSDEAAAFIAGEMSSGTFVDLPGETEEVKQRAAARVVSVIEVDRGPASLATRLTTPDEVVRFDVDIDIPAANIAGNLANLFSAVSGNIYELGELTGLRLLDIDVSAAIRQQFALPSHGVTGTRELLDAPIRALFGTIIKPSVGLDPAQTAVLVSELVGAGVDFIKDDELMASPTYSPLSERVQAIGETIDRYTQQTGRPVLYACNITADYDQMMRNLDHLTPWGFVCPMVTVNSVGASAVAALRRATDRPIHGHRAGWGMLSRHPLLGMSFTAYQKLWRLAGVDHLHTSGLASKFSETDEAVTEAISACLRDIAPGDAVLPVLSGGQWAWQAYETRRLIGSSDYLLLAGGGIIGHPDGASAGVQSLHDASDAAARGVTFTEARASSPAVDRAAAAFDKKGERA